MSVYNNTLNAYVARLNAKRKAEEREAKLAERRKSAEQREADKKLYEQAKVEKQLARDKEIYNAANLATIWLDNVAKEYKQRHNAMFRDGERARALKDLRKISQLFYYDGPGKFSLKVDLSDYSKTAYGIIISVLVCMKVFDREQADATINEKLRAIVVIRNNDKVAAVSCDPDSNVAKIKEAVKDIDNEGYNILALPIAEIV